MYEILLLDMDDTILDFRQAEQVALRRTLQEFGLQPTEEVCARYSRINQNYWEMLERKEVTLEQLRPGRFRQLFSEYGMDADADACAVCYMDNLGQCHQLLPGAVDALAALSRKYALYLVSNGTTKVQLNRIQMADIGKYFRGIFISQQVGVEKPDPRFFAHCFARIPNFQKEKAMIVGDSLTSDILGGINAGIATCWVNAHHKPARADIPADYQIESLTQLETLLKTL